MNVIRLGTVGRRLQVRFTDALTGGDFDISGATSIQYIITKDNGVSYTRTGSVLSGSTAISDYSLVADDTDTRGILEWYVIYNESGSGVSIPSEKFRVRVV